MMVGQQADTMANPEHLAKLKEGVEAWNKWRRDHSETTVDLAGAELLQADLRGAHLWSANLTHSNLSGARMDKAQFLYADLTYARLLGAGLHQAQLQSAVLNSADLSSCDFRAADLRRVDLRASDVTNANLRGADLREANLMSATLRSTLLAEANMAGAITGWTVFGDNDLETVVGLDDIDHHGPSTIGIDTIYQSKGRISEVFLRGCGVPENFIVFAKSLVASPIELYSCFISYSSKDDAFAAELYAKLQAQQVRCWKDSEDLKIGDRFQDVIENAIQLHDKLLVVLSENSVNSAWVEREVQAAFEKEQRQGATVLFPVRLDDAVMDCPRAWAADIRRTRHIGDFRKWKDHDSFQKSLDRLLRDLRSEASRPK
jgi:uncharacterized protein YjbI with pentapeptide repeats